MVNLINFYKTEDKKYGFEIKYQDSRQDLTELRPVEKMSELLEIMSDFEGEKQYSKINKINFSEKYENEEKNILETVISQYIKSSNEIEKLKMKIDITESYTGKQF